MCSGGQITGLRTNALTADAADGLRADKAEIGGSVFVVDGFKLEGIASFAGATIHNFLYWRELSTNSNVTLDLRFARVGGLVDDKNSWPSAGKLFLNGFVYDGIGTKSPTDARSRISWLHLQPTDRFLPQPYEQLAEVLRKTGHEDDAKDVLIAKNRDRASRANWYNPIRSWYFLLDITIGYGYQPWYAFWESVGFVAFGAYLFRKAKKAGIMAPTDGGDSPRNGLRFSGFVYSLETFVPLINLAMAEHWLPVGEGKMEFRLGKRTFHVAENGLRRYLYVHKAVGWVLTTLWVGGLTGLIKI